MSSPDAAKPAQRLLWGMVLGIVLLNAVLFFVYARTHPPDAPPETSHTDRH